MLIFVATLVAGFIAGSFLTSFVGRLHDGRDFIRSRSACNTCRKSLGILDLVPLLSWLALRGRCRHCKQRVSCYYPAVEAVTVASFMAFYAFWPYSFAGWELVLFAGYLLALVVLLALAIYDLRWWLLPNKLTYPLAGWALALLGIRLLIEFDPRSAAGGAVECFGRRRPLLRYFPDCRQVHRRRRRQARLCLGLAAGRLAAVAADDFPKQSDWDGRFLAVPVAPTEGQGFQGQVAVRPLFDRSRLAGLLVRRLLD